MELSPHRRSETLLEQIEEQIVTGRFAPGARLDETQLGATFGVSRTPVREALFQLAAIGMVVKRPRHGWSVTEVSPDRLSEMFEVMAELEGMCGRLAARRATHVQQHRIKEAHEACRGVGDPDRYYRLNEVFHQTIYDASGNAFLIEQTRELQRRTRPYRRLQLRVRARLAASFEEHQGIVEAILAGESALVEERLRSHVTVQGQRFSDLLASVERLRAP